MKKRLIAIVLAIAALASICLTGCGKKGENGGKNEDADQLSAKYAFLVDYKTINYDNLQYINSMVISGNKIFLNAEVVTGKETYTDETTGESWDYDKTEPVILSMELDGSNVQRLAGYTPAVENGEDSGSYVQSMEPTADGGFIIIEYAYAYSYELPADFDPYNDNKWDYQTGSTQEYYIHKFDTQGNEISATKVPDVGADYVGSIKVDSKGNIIFTDWTNLYLVNAEGQLVKTIEANNIGDLQQISADEIGAVVYSEDYSGSSFKLINMTTGEFGDEIKLAQNAYNLMPGFGEYRYCYNNNGNIFGYNETTDTSDKLVDWMDYDVDSSNIQSFTMKDDGTVIALSTTWSNNSNKTEIITLTPTDPSNIVQKKELTLACMYLDWNLRSRIIEFNKKNNEYRIKVKDYSEYATDDDYDAGLTKLNTEIISGNVPDMIYTANIPIAKYAGRDVLEDLWPYIENDTRFGRSDLLENVFQAVEIDGKLYQTVSSFSVQTTAGLTSVVGDKLGWTLDDLKAALATLPEGAQVFNTTATKTDIINSFISMNMSSYIDWETGKCSFDTPEFISILEFAASFADDSVWDDFNWDEYEDDYTRMKEGKQLLNTVYLYNFDSAQEMKSSLGSDVTYVGFPADEGYGAAFSVNDGIAMSKTCSNKDVAWQFMGQFLTEEYQSDNMWGGFSTNKKAFEKQAENAMKQEYTADGEPIPLYSYGTSNSDEMIDVYAMTQAEYDKIMEVINSTTRVMTYDQEVLDIIKDETSAFFEGQKSAEETAKMIQSRVGLYVGEQM